MTVSPNGSSDEKLPTYEELKANCARLEHEVSQTAVLGRWKARFADAARGDQDLNVVLRVVRDLLVEERGFDRAGVFSYDPVTETFKGAWGTDLDGKVEDLSKVRIRSSHLEDDASTATKPGGKGFRLRHFETDEVRAHLLPEMAHIRDHLELYLHCQGELVGYVGIDNGITNRPITESQTIELLPLMEFASLVVLAAVLREKRDNLIRQQQRVMDIALAITSNRDPDTVNLMVRNAILEIGFVDRAALWVISDAVAHGTWGTSELGELTDEHHLSFPFLPESDFVKQFDDPDCPFVIRMVGEIDGEGNTSGVPHAFIPLRVNGEIIGIVTVDTFITRRRITPAMLTPVMPITDQAAVAIQKSRLLAEREAVVRQQRRLMEISAAIAANEDSDAVFQMVRDAILETRLVDRVGVWLVDGDTARGTWGTSATGERSDEHHNSFPLKDYRKEFSACLLEDAPFCIDDAYTVFGDNFELKANVPYGVVPLKTEKHLMGILTVDNLLTGRKLTPDRLEIILPLARQAAIALLGSQLRAERESVIQQQRKLMDIASAIAADADSDSVFRTIRDAILEMGLVDRVGVWLVDGSEAHGTWGTNELGLPVDEHGQCFFLEGFREDFAACLAGEGDYVIDESYTAFSDGVAKHPNTPFAIIPLRAGNRLIGMLTLDNVLTKRQLTSVVLELILPLAKHASIAILNSDLREQREKLINHQTRLMKIAVAIVEDKNTDAVFRMVRDAIIEIGSVDRAIVWLIDGDVARGTWGTDDLGCIIDLHDVSFAFPEHQEFARIMYGEAPFVIDTRPGETLATGEVRRNVPHALIPLRAGPDLIGALDLDTLITMRPIAEEAMELVLPLAKLAAIVVVKRRMFIEARLEIERRRQAETLLLAKTDELITARDEALAGVRAKSQFLANMSHEIRTPMNGVVGMTSLLLMTPLSDQQLGYTKTVQKSAGALLSLIDDILDFSRLEVGKLRITNQPFDLRGCIEDVVEIVGSQMMEGAVGLRCRIAKDFPTLLIGDRHRVRQVITNLLANAVKFTHRGEISVHAECLYESSTRADVLIEVRDTGVGIAVGQQAAVFESFTQADGTSTRRHDGAGLGLTITKQLVELMGGTIHLESSPGKGTTVGLEMTFGKAAPETILVEQPPSEGAVALCLQILVAEDNAVNMLVVVGRLEAWGCRCVEVQNGIEALEALSTRQFDVVLMDVSMPGMDGIEATRELRRREEATGAHLPVIAMTAHAMEGDRERCLSAGMDEYVSKPINFNELLQKLQAVG